MHLFSQRAPVSGSWNYISCSLLIIRLVRVHGQKGAKAVNVRGWSRSNVRGFILTWSLTFEKWWGCTGIVRSGGVEVLGQRQDHAREQLNLGELNIWCQKKDQFWSHKILRCWSICILQSIIKGDCQEGPGMRKKWLFIKLREGEVLSVWGYERGVISGNGEEKLRCMNGRGASSRLCQEDITSFRDADGLKRTLLD